MNGGSSFGSVGGSLSSSGGLLSRSASASTPEGMGSGLAFHHMPELKEAVTALAIIIRERTNIRACLDVSFFFFFACVNVYLVHKGVEQRVDYGSVQNTTRESHWSLSCVG